eukprot:scaffold13307_cov30-Phaeocystis_antarctica.AAC.1
MTIESEKTAKGISSAQKSRPFSELGVTSPYPIVARQLAVAPRLEVLPLAQHQAESDHSEARVGGHRSLVVVLGRLVGDPRRQPQPPHTRAEPREATAATTRVVRGGTGRARRA